MILDSACFHCQQAIEKFLKAFLAFHGQEIERTHNIIFLLSECSNYDPIFADIDPGNINEYEVQGRYPDSSLMPTPEEAVRFLKLTLRVKALIVERIIFT